MTLWRQFVQNTLTTGQVSSAATTLAIGLCGSLENRNSLAPINAISHIAWGEKAATREGPSLKYTVTGLVLNTAAVTGWAGFYELLFGRRADTRDVPGALVGGGITSAVAYITDYHVVPPRFTPGFEKRLSGRSLLVIYATLGLSLGIGALGGRNRRTRR